MEYVGRIFNYGEITIYIHALKNVLLTQFDLKSENPLILHGNFERSPLGYLRVETQLYYVKKRGLSWFISRKIGRDTFHFSKVFTIIDGTVRESWIT